MPTCTLVMWALGAVISAYTSATVLGPAPTTSADVDMSARVIGVPMIEAPAVRSKNHHLPVVKSIASVCHRPSEVPPLRLPGS